MLHSIANHCTAILVNNGIVKEEKSSVLIYGFQLFISTASNIRHTAIQQTPVQGCLCYMHFCFYRSVHDVGKGIYK